MAEGKQRLAYIDWLRGLACVGMFQAHCYDSWLSEEARASGFFMWSRLGGTLPAPLFLFLAGVSFALVTERLRARGMPANEVGRVTIRRGAQILALALLFRLQEFLLGQPWAPWTDLLRVDILNTIGVSMILMGLLCCCVGLGGFKDLRQVNLVAAATAALAIAVLTPPLWTTWRPRWLPWFLESYLNGVHTYPEPQPWLFPVFPWAAFAFAGLAAGFALFSGWARRNEVRSVLLLGVGGVALWAVARWLDVRPQQLYAVYDFWHTSPNFFLIRLGILFVVTLGAYVWCRWGAGQWGFSPLIQLGQTSLLVYWVHIEFVYGRFSILPKRSVNIQTATLGLLVIATAMVALSIARTQLKGRGTELAGWFRKVVRARQG